MPFESVVVVVVLLLVALDKPTVVQPPGSTVHVMVALATPWPLASSAWTVMGWKNCSVHCWEKHGIWPSPAMILSLATVCAAAP